MTYPTIQSQTVGHLAPNHSSLRVLYAAGPGDVLGTYHYWVNNQDDPNQVSVTYSGQFYELCNRLNAEAYILSYNKNKTFASDKQFTIEHRPKTLKNLPGIFYHLSEIWYGIQLITSALLWKADVIIVSDGTTHWFLLSILDFLGISVVPVLHCTLWRQYVRPKKSEQFILDLSKTLFSKCAGILSASDDISTQVRQLTRGNNSPIFEFLPLYRRSEFSGVKRSDLNQVPFRVLFMGRIETDKGVFDLLEIAKQFKAAGPSNIHFDICGDGSELERLHYAVKDAGLESVFTCHGYCKKPKMREILEQSHVVIAPTKTDFVEGFCQAAAEGILVGRPVITSAVCPALSYIRPGVVEVQPNDIQGYANAILRLFEDKDFYEEKRQGCMLVQEQFYDPSKSWTSALELVLKTISLKTAKATKSHTV